MSIDIEQAIASGDPALIDAAFAAMSKAEDQGEAQPTPQASSAAPDDRRDSSHAAEDTGQPAHSETADTDTEKLLAKDGRELPYAVLHGTRKQLRAEREARLELERKLAELQKQEEGDFSLEELEELSPEVAGAFKNLQARVADAERRAGTAMTHEQIQVEFAKQSNPDLLRWESSDPDRWSLAVEIDTALREQPDYANKTMAERFADVVQLVKRETGEPVTSKSQPASPFAERAQAIVARQQQDSAGIPKTLTDTGAHFSEAQRKQVDIWADKSVEQIAEDMAKMTPEQRRQYL